MPRDTGRIERVSPGTTCYNQLEDAHYTATEDKCFIVTGTRGEQWMTSEAKIRSTYNLDQDTLKKLDAGEYISGDFSPKQDAAICWMRKADAYEKVETSWGEVLSANRPGIEHGAGDMVVCYSDRNGMPNANDRAVINGAVFEDTYQSAERQNELTLDELAEKILNGEDVQPDQEAPENNIDIGDEAR